MSMIMRVTLPQDASNTYYGQWSARILEKRGRIDLSIAHNDIAARAKFGGRRRAGPRFSGNRGSSFWEIYLGAKEISGEPEAASPRRITSGASVMMQSAPMPTSARASSGSLTVQTDSA